MHTMQALMMFLQDTDMTQSQQAGVQAAKMMMAIMPIFMLIGLAVLAFFIFLFWRIFTKAGMSGAMSLIVLIPGIGSLIVLCILAFSDWPAVTKTVVVVPPPPGA